MLWWTRYCELPFPVKLGANTALVQFVLLFLVPGPPTMPPIGLLVIWLTAFSFGFILAAGSPLRSPRIHWLHAVINDEWHELRWD